MASPDLAVDADLTVERDGAEALRVSGDGAVVEVIIRSAGAALALARDAGLGSGTRRRMLSHAAGLLARGGLTAEVRVGAVLVARAGASVRAGILSRLAGLERIDVRLGGLVAAVLVR